MKKIFLFLLFAVTGMLKADAQNGLSANALASLGPFGNEAQLGLEYKVNRFSLGLGIAYFSSDYRKDSLAVPYPNSYNYNQQVTFRHFFIPVSFGYHIPMGNRFFVVPMATLGVSYNTSAKYMSWTDHYLNLYERNLTATEFAQNYRQVSMWGGLALRFAYKISDRINILAALHGKTTILPINKSGTQQWSGSGGLGFGVQYYFVAYR